MNPTAKKNLLVETLPGETLVYDLDRHRAHCLNPDAASLLERADGTRTVKDLSRALEETRSEEVTEDAVLLGLDRLRRAGLVDWHPPADLAERSLPEGPTRREALRTMGKMGLFLPMVMTIRAPQGAQGTAIPPGQCAGPENVGSCCRNRRICILEGGRYRCKGAPC